MSIVSPSKEKFCSILSEIIDKSKNIIANTDEPLGYDAVELTLLLKSIGFRLNSLEFDGSPKQDSKNIEIEIRCRQSGMVSKLILLSDKCTCPNRKSANNNSFWEVQGISPATPIAKTKDIIQDTSCNLLPEITKKTSNTARTMLTVFLQHFESDFKQKLNEKQNNTDKLVPENLVNVKIERTLEPKQNNYIIRNENNNNDGNSHCSTPLSSINVTPIPSYTGPIVNSGPKNILHDQNGNEIKNGDGSHENVFLEPESLISIRSEPVASSSKECSLEQLNADTERDICLIKSIEDARKKLDSALLMLKCNLTRDLSHSSILTVTPQNIKCPIPSIRVSNAKPLISSNRKTAMGNSNSSRRHSTGTGIEIKKITPNKTTLKSITAVIDNRRKPGGIQNSKLFNQDTPRPANDKQTKPTTKYLVKRTATGTNLKSVTSKIHISKSTGKLNAGCSTKK